MYYVYFLQSQLDGQYYVGVTNDLVRRMREHESGSVKSTAPYRPWNLKKIEVFQSIEEAYRRERFIKAKHSRKIIEKIIES